MNTKTEYLTEENSKVVRLSRALCITLEDIGLRLETKTINDTLAQLIQPIGRAIRHTHGKINVTVLFNILDNSVTLKFEPKEKLRLREKQ